MVHQFEEHDRDHFRQGLNEEIGHGLEVMEPEYVFWVNVPGVWESWAACCGWLMLWVHSTVESSLPRLPHRLLLPAPHQCLSCTLWRR